MADVSPSSDQAADLLQNLSLDSQPKAIEAPDPTKKNGSGFSTCPPNGTAKPFCPSAGYLPNGFVPPTYYYGAYDTQGNTWNDYSLYVNAEGSMAQNMYGDNCYVFPQGYGYAPFGPYTPPTSPAPTMQHEAHMCAMPHYQYHSTYYQNHAPNRGSSAAQGHFSTSVAVDQLPLSFDINKASNSLSISGDVVNEKNGMKALVKGPQGSSVSDNKKNPDLLPCIPFPGYPDVRGFPNSIQPQIPLGDAPAFCTGLYKRGARAGVSPSYVEDYQSWSNMQSNRPVPGLGLASGFMNEVFSGNRMYGRYGNPLRSGSGFASSGYDYRTNGRGWTTDARFKPGGFGNRAVNYGKENFNAFNELNKGPRSKGSDNKNQKGMGPFTLLLKGQSLPVCSDDKSLIPTKGEFSGESFADNYEHAKFFVVKSYSEDDIHKSIKYGVWASTPNGNKKLNAAYLEAKEKTDACPIFLLFSVNASGQFVGLAEMIGPVDFDKTVEYWQQDKWNGCFPVKWHIIKDVPNGLLKHIILENNENKPVTNSRDTQEVKLDQGIEIVKIFESHSSKTCILDDFEFYDSRQKTMQESKSKDKQFRKQAVEVIDLDLASMRPSVVAETGDETVTVSKGFGDDDIEASEESATACKISTADSSGVATAC